MPLKDFFATQYKPEEAALSKNCSMTDIKLLDSVRGTEVIFSLMTRFDKVILAVFLFLSLGSFLLRGVWQEQGSEAVIEINGRLYAKINLLQPARLQVPGVHGEISIIVKDGALWVQESSCTNKVCKQRGKIRLVGDMIICAPNRVVVRIVGKSPHPFDMITG